MNKKTYENLNNFTHISSRWFFWEFNARANKLNFLFSEIKINHRKRSSGDTKIYTFGKLPKIAYNNLVGLIKLKKKLDSDINYRSNGLEINFKIFLKKKVNFFLLIFL